MDLILASASPRRQALLRGLGLPFMVRCADIDETMDASRGAQAEVARVSRLKAEAVLAEAAPDAAVIAADAAGAASPPVSYSRRNPSSSPNPARKKRRRAAKAARSLLRPSSRHRSSLSSPAPRQQLPRAATAARPSAAAGPITGADAAGTRVAREPRRRANKDHKKSRRPPRGRRDSLS